MNTDFLRKNGPVSKHGNKVFNGLSAAAVVWIFATFATKEACNENSRRCEGGADKCEQKRSKQWQKIADLELEVERLKLRSPRASLWDEPIEQGRWVALPGDSYTPPYLENWLDVEFSGQIDSRDTIAIEP